GETFVRRARQLVKQQRAAWIDDSHTAIRFAPGMEKMEESPMEDINTAHAMHGYDRDEELLRFAKRRVHARLGFRVHRSVVISLSVFFTVVYILTNFGGHFWPVWPIMAMGMGIFIHWVVYKNICGDSLNSKIAYEYEMLKHKHPYTDNH
ncbi:MAG: 2TM domain-containing protein, partial [Defluviitaleaceae bacterium]|nr:2TM domain-containing protein [Defluviitaleaceae bacterium]